jgi:hypothetical protein
MRCYHEASMHKQNSFITLTYNPEHLPDDNSLNKRHFQLFMKKLRKQISPKKIRYFHCGEYGEERGRPHYHACLFGHDFEDKKLYKTNNNNKLYISQILQDTWGQGFATTGDVTFESAAYVARYILKKVTGELAEKHYQGVQPEYTTMSRRPGVGKHWLEHYNYEPYQAGGDFVVINGKKMRPPNYYDKQLEKEHPARYTEVTNNRKIQARLNPEHHTTARLKVRETVRLAKIQSLKRHNGETL